MYRRSCSLVKRYSLIPALITFVLVFVHTAAGQAISGTVSDAADGFSLPGATVTVVDASGSLIAGAATDLDGAYSVTVGASGNFTVFARFVGYQEAEQSVTLSVGQTLSLNFALSQTGFELNTVVVAASRRQEKALDAPASVSVLNATEVAADVGPSSIEALRSTTGVDMAQTGIDRREVVLRGFNNAFSGAAYILTDYRHAAVPSLNVNITSIMPSMNIDVERIEVVRGPGSALYGAGVDAGVIHFISKDPFTHPGTTLSISGGERSYFGAQFRHAGVLGSSGNVGYKITGMYGQANDWELDPDDPIDAIQIGQDRLTPGTASVRNPDYQKLNVNGNLEYRFGPLRSLIFNAGHADLTAAVLSGIGTVQADGFGYSYGQLRLLMDNFFAQVYINKNSAGNSSVYGLDIAPVGGDLIHDTVVDNGILYNAQAQYDLDMLNGKQNFIFGVDIELTRPDTEGTINGRNEDNDNIDEYGGYIQSTTQLTQQISLTLAGRGDYNTVQEEFTVSPRAAVVFSPIQGHSFRATYNRAFSSPTSNSNFLDINAGEASPGTGLFVRGRGSASGFTWPRNSAYAAISGSDLVTSSLNPATIGAEGPAGLPLENVYASLYAGLAALPTAAVTAQLNDAGLPVDDATTAQLIALLSPDAGTSVSGFSRGLLGIINLTTLAPAFVNDLTDIAPLKASISETIEVGYKGLFNNKILIAIDAYYSKKKNFVGPLLMETPIVLVPNLNNDLSAALTDGIEGNALLNGALGQFGVSAEAAADLIVELAADQLPSASTPVSVVQAVESGRGPGDVPELMLSYRNFGNVDFYGIDASVEVMVNEQLSVFGNMSYVSDDFFDEDELEEPGTGLELALNAPRRKYRGGFRYQMESGFSINASVRHTSKYPIRSGPYIGDLKKYTLVDVGVGYDLDRYAPGLRIDLGVSNVTDELHREFIGAPQLGRMGIARVTYNVR